MHALSISLCAVFIFMFSKVKLGTFLFDDTKKT